MPVDLKLLGEDGKRLFREWKEKVKKHNSYLVKNKYHKERKMDKWNQELNELNDHYRKVLKSMESEKKKQVMELEKAAKEAERLAKEAEQKAKEERARKRKMKKDLVGSAVCRHCSCQELLELLCREYCDLSLALQIQPKSSLVRDLEIGVGVALEDSIHSWGECIMQQGIVFLLELSKHLLLWVGMILDDCVQRLLDVLCQLV